MSLEVTVTVRIINSSGECDVSLRQNRRPVGDNPRFNALTAEQAIVDAGRAILAQIVALDGDIRDDDVSLSNREMKRVLT